METRESNRSWWRFVDGSLSVTVSMATAVAISTCRSCSGVWGVGFFRDLTDKDDGVIILATLLLFPTTVALYGVLQMWFAAKEAVEKRATERGRREGRREERERISKALAQHGVELPPEVAGILAGEPDDNPPAG